MSRLLSLVHVVVILKGVSLVRYVRLLRSSITASACLRLTSVVRVLVVMLIRSKRLTAVTQQIN